MEFQYKGLSAQIEALRVTDEEIDRNLERLKGQELPEMSPEELRRSVAAALQAHYDERAEEDLLDRLIRQAAATLDFTPAEEAVNEAAQAQMELLSNQLAQRNLSVGGYCEFMSTTPKQLLEDMRLDSRELLRVQAAIDRIAELEQISVEDAEMQAAYEEICKKNQVALEELQTADKDALENAVRTGILQRKVLQFVRDAANITVVAHA